MGDAYVFFHFSRSSITSPMYGMVLEAEQKSLIVWFDLLGIEVSFNAQPLQRTAASRGCNFKPADLTICIPLRPHAHSCIAVDHSETVR